MITFKEYKDFGCGMCAVFTRDFIYRHTDSISNELRLNKESLESRIKNVENEQRDASVERQALENFPKDSA